MRVHLFVSPDSAELEVAAKSGADALWLETPGETVRAQTANLKLYACLSALDDNELDTAMAAAPDGIIVPVRHGPDVQNLGVRLAIREAELGLADGTIRIIARVGAPTALLRLDSFVGTSQRLLALAFDVQAFAISSGIANLNAAPLRLARDLALLAAKAAGVAAILVEPTRSSYDYEAAQRDGFDTIVVRDPANVARVRTVFS